MSKINREELESKANRESLETLVAARTEQLRQALQKNSDLLEFLKQLQSMQSLNEIRQAVKVEIAKLEPQSAASVPRFGGNPGEPVPEVDPDDLKTLWRETNDLQAQHAGQNVAIGLELMKTTLKPGANAEAIFYRSSMIWLLKQFAPDQLAPWIRDGQVSDAVFRTIAMIPMEWIGHTVREGLPFDVEDFFRRLSGER